MIAYKQCTRFTNSQTKYARRQYYNKILLQNSNNMKFYWKILNEIIGKNKTASYPSYFEDKQGKVEDNPLSIANNFNNFFVNSGASLADKIPKSIRHFSDYLAFRNPSTIYLNPLTTDETRKLIINLKDCAVGWDNINKSVMVNILNDIITPLTHVLNLSISQGIFPEDLKIAKVKPLFKANEKHSYNNHRPISLLTTISKIFERVMYNRHNILLIDLTLFTINSLVSDQIIQLKWHLLHLLPNWQKQKNTI